MEVTKEITMPRYISASQLGLFLTSPMEYAKKYLSGVKPENDASIYSVYGGALHKALELNFKQKITSKVDLNPQELIAEFTRVFEKELQTVKNMRQNEEATLRAMPFHAANSIEKYMKNFAPHIQPVMVEHRFEIVLKNFPITIVGFFDLVTENDTIVDYKTAGKDFKKDWAQKEVDINVQGTLYSAAFRKIMGKRESGIAFDVMPRVAGVDPFRMLTQRSDEQVRYLLEIATKMRKIIELDLVIPSWEDYKANPLGGKI